MSLLLDTHALLWWLAGDERLPPKVRARIGADSVFVSPVSAYEIAFKHALGKLPGARSVATGFAAMVRSQAFIELPISIEHAAFAGRLAAAHRDPFDRLLMAQALTEDLTLVSNERLFDAFGVARLW